MSGRVALCQQKDVDGLENFSGCHCMFGVDRGVALRIYEDTVVVVRIMPRVHILFTQLKAIG